MPRIMVPLVSLVSLVSLVPSLAEGRRCVVRSDRRRLGLPDKVSQFLRIIQNCFKELRCARIEEATCDG